MNLATIAASAMRAVPVGVRAAIVFTKETPATVDAATNRPGAPASRTVRGNAVEEDADPKRYADLNLHANEFRTVFFIPDTPGELPALDSECTWGGRPWTLRAVDPLAPNGTPLGASLVLSR
jgi:hypothetical protein